MSVKVQKVQLLLSILILCGMLTCAFFGWHSSSHFHAWGYAFFGLVGLNSFLQYRRVRNLPAFNPLISLFPKSQPPQKDHKQ